MISKIKSFYYYIFQQHNLPVWIVYLNYGSLIGIIGWPLIAFLAIFLSDSPASHFTGLDYLFIISYPIGLILITFVSFKIFTFNKFVSASLPVAVIICYLFILYKFFFN